MQKYMGESKKKKDKSHLSLIWMRVSHIALYPAQTKISFFPQIPVVDIEPRRTNHPNNRLVKTPSPNA